MKLFISKLHYEKNPDFLKKCLIGLLSLCSVPYRAVTSVRNFLYDAKLIKSSEFKDVTEISRRAVWEKHRLLRKLQTITASSAEKWQFYQEVTAEVCPIKK